MASTKTKKSVAQPKKTARTKAAAPVKPGRGAAQRASKSAPGEITAAKMAVATKAPPRKAAPAPKSKQMAVKKAAAGKAAKPARHGGSDATLPPVPGWRRPVVQHQTAAKKVSRGLTARDRETLRVHLIATRNRLKHQVDVLKGESLQRTEEIVTEEDGTYVFDRQFALTLASTEQDAIYDIDDALRRLDDGKYGACEECSCIIEPARLRALPFVRLCIACQSARERTRPRFRPME